MELYIHIPFCVKKCAYCDFLSAPADADTRKKYLERLIGEMKHVQADYSDHSVSSVFVGGGTPTIYEGEALGQLMEAVYEHFHIEENAEITMECNPGTLTLEKAQLLRKAGVNRLSLGLQSANNEELKLLGRIHTFEEFLESFQIAREAGFSNINVDLMSALPGQTQISWADTLQKVTALNPEHISAYSLIIEEGTPFFEQYSEDCRARERGEDPRWLPSEDAERAMYAYTVEYLKNRGYFRYEISNYAKPGFECRHNQGYWTREEYLGLGLGAASFVDQRRFSNTGNLRSYLEDPFGHDQEEVLTEAAQMEEFMFLGLRRMEGVSRQRFREEFYAELDEVFGSVLDRLIQQKLLTEQKERIFLTPKGIDVSNWVLSHFLLDEEK